MPRSNIEQLIAAAEALRPLLSELVFVGGAVTTLLVDEGAGAARPTLDVDAIAEITSYAEYAAFGERLGELGFSEDIREGAPLCRWVKGENVVDVMPLDARILGFSNRWYRPAMDTASDHEFPGGLTIRVVTAPYFLATKIEAFRGRGNRDFAVSHDLEDIVFVIDGRSSILEEVHGESSPLKDYFQVQFKALVETPSFIDSLPGYLLPDAASQARLSIVIERMQKLAGLIAG